MTAEAMDHDLPAWTAARQAELEDALRDHDWARASAIADDILVRDPGSAALLTPAADVAVQRRDWDRAVRLRAAICAVRPTDRKARIALARALLGAGAMEAAHAVADRLLQTGSTSAAILRLKLEILVREDNPRQLDAWLSRLSDTGGAAHESFAVEVIQMLASSQRFDEAKAWLESAIEKHGRTAGLVRQAALTAYRARRWTDADALWAEVARTRPSEARAAAFHRARIALNEDRRTDAEAHYLEAFEHEPGSAEAAHFLIRRLAGNNRTDEAEALLARFRQAVGETPRSVWLEAVLATARRDLANATRVLADGVSRWPDNTELRLQWADLLADSRDWRGMEKVLQAPELDADAPATLQRIIALRVGRQDSPTEILDAVDRLLSHQPSDEGLLRQKANQLVQMGERRAAADVLLEAVGLHPTVVSFWQSAAANLLMLADGPGLEQLLQRARLRFGRGSVSDLSAQAEIFEAADRIDEALALARQASALDPSAVRPRLLAARLLEAKGRYREAWPELLAISEIEAPRERTAGSFARIAGALGYVDARPLADARNDLFPEAVFERIGREARPDPRNDQPVVLQVTGSLAAGGAERQVAVTTVGLARNERFGLTPVLVGHDLNALTGRDFFLSMVEHAGVEVEVLRANRAAGKVRDMVAADPSTREAVALLSALPVDVANVALPLYQLIRERRPRVVHLWQDSISVAGGMAALVAGTPRIILGARSTRPAERQRARRWLRAGYHALLGYPGTAMLNNSINGARDYADWLGIDPERIITVHNGYNFEAMRRRADPAVTREVRARVNAGPDDVVIGGVMRCSFEKRPDLWLRTVIELARRHPHVRGVLVGEGPMAPELEAMLAGAGMTGRIWIAGRQSPIEPWMRAMDFLFLTSLTEGLPNVLIEAQALGTPVATMRVGGAPETVVENETGLVVDEGSDDMIAGAIEPLATDAALRSRLAEAGPRFAEASFGISSTLERLAQVYDTPTA